jgi:hypothetical protein
MWSCYNNRERREEYLRTFPGLREMSRDQQKREALAVIQRYKDDPALLSHPETEPAVLPDGNDG